MIYFWNFCIFYWDSEQIFNYNKTNWNTQDNIGKSKENPQARWEPSARHGTLTFKLMELANSRLCISLVYVFLSKIFSYTKKSNILNICSELKNCSCFQKKISNSKNIFFKNCSHFQKIFSVREFQKMFGSSEKSCLF